MKCHLCGGGNASHRPMARGGKGCRRIGITSRRECIIASGKPGQKSAGKAVSSPGGVHKINRKRLESFTLLRCRQQNAIPAHGQRHRIGTQFQIEIRNGTLFIYTSVAPLKNELVFQKDLILQRVNESMGEQVVKEVVIA